MNESLPVPAELGMTDGIPVADINTFHQAYGEAMSLFGGVESSMMLLFRSLMRPENPFCAFNAFRSGVGFQGQLGMLTALVETVFDDGEVRDAWKKLKTRIDGVQQARNVIAHMHVWHMNRHAPYGSSPKNQRKELPLEWEDRKKRSEVITTDKLVEMGKNFAAVSRAIIEFEDEADKVRRAAKSAAVQSG